jgi:prophage tail gpP-like protein
VASATAQERLAVAEGHFECRLPGLNISLRDGDGGEIRDWSIDSSFLTATDSWTMSVIDNRPLPRWYELQPVELYVDGRLQLIGRVDTTDRGGEGHIVKLQGRDYLADMAECNVDPTVTFKAGTTLETAILTACAPLGITSIVDPYERNQERTGKTPKRGQPLTKKQITDAKPEPGASIFSWCNRLAARYGYTIQPGNKRTELVLQRPTYGGGPVGRIVRQRSNLSANVLRANAARNYGSVPTYFLGAARQGTSKEQRTNNRKNWDLNEVVRTFASEELQTIVWNGTVAGRMFPKGNREQGSTAQLYRLRHFRDKDSKNAEQLAGAAARMIAGALKELLRYSVTLRGTNDPITGAVWSYDCEVEVDDDLARVSEILWVAGRKFSSSQGDVTTELECWRPRTYQIDPEAG